MTSEKDLSRIIRLALSALQWATRRLVRFPNPLATGSDIHCKNQICVWSKDYNGSIRSQTFMAVGEPDHSPAHHCLSDVDAQTNISLVGSNSF